VTAGARTKANVSSTAEAGTVPAAPCRFLAARPGAEDIERLVAGGEPVAVGRGDHVFSEGDVLEAVYVIRRGTVALRRSVRGRDVTLLRLRDGDILGDVPMLLRAPAAFDAVAERETDLVHISAGRLLATLDRSPEFARRWVLWLSGRLASTQLRLLSVLAGDMRAQVAAVLLQEACRGDTVHITHQEIAEMVGAQRASVTRALDELADLGALTRGYGQIRVVDADLLGRAASGLEPHASTI
jgi:CRP-like cAMP-binding protein